MAKRKTRRRSYRRPKRRRTYRRNPAVRASTNRRSSRRRRRYRRNPLLPTRLLQQALTLGAGYLAAPIVSNMIPWTPASKLGQYAKTAIVVTLGGQLVSKALGKKYGNALTAGGWLWIAVDALQSQVQWFGGRAAAPEGMGYYFPTDAELLAGGYDAGVVPSGAGAGTFGSPTFVH